MNRDTLVWDLPTRLFHVLLAGAFLGAYVIALTVDDDSPRFAVHMLLGAVAGFAVLLRAVWGFVGSRYARFASFVPGGRALVAYLRGLFERAPAMAALGHNPASSVVIFAMLAAVLGTALSGALMGTYQVFEEVHEVFAHGLFALAAVHVAGVIVHVLRHRDGLALSMVDGKKVGPAREAIASSHPLVAAMFVGLTALWGVALVRGYDGASGTVTLPLIGTTLALGEGGEGEHEGRGGDRRDGEARTLGRGSERARHHDDDDDDD